MLLKIFDCYSHLRRNCSWFEYCAFKALAGRHHWTSSKQSCRAATSSNHHNRYFAVLGIWKASPVVIDAVISHLRRILDKFALFLEIEGSKWSIRDYDTRYQHRDTEYCMKIRPKRSQSRVSYRMPPEYLRIECVPYINGINLRPSSSNQGFPYDSRAHRMNTA